MKKYGMLTLTILTFLCSLTALFLAWQGQRRDAFIDLAKVYNGYKYKTDLEEEYHGIQDNRKKTLDSLMLNLKFLSDQVDKKPSPIQMELYQRKRIEFREIQERFESDNERMVNTYRDKIFKRINEALKTYGQEAGYDYIFGAEGSGVLMYTNKSKNISEAVIQYLNEHYQPTQQSPKQPVNPQPAKPNP